MLDTYNVGGHLLSPLINGDVSGVDASDELALERFVSDMQGGDPRPLVFIVEDGEPSFCRCEVTGLLNMCHELSVWYV